MKTILIVLTVASILSQIPHVYHTFNSFSRLNGIIRELQSLMFCGILSVSIYTFVVIGETHLAVMGAIIEVIINMYYFSMDFWANGYGKKKEKMKSTLKFWRQNWFALFTGVLLPVMIYVFSEQLKNFI